MQIEQININNLRMKYFRFGNGKKIFVIIPGLSVQSIMISSQEIVKRYSILKDEFTCYVFDRKDNVTFPYTNKDISNDMVLAIKELGLQNIYVFGASQGGMIAMQMAIDNPNLINKMILGSTSARIDNFENIVISEWIDLAQKKEKELLYDSFAKHIYPANIYDKYKDVFRKVSKMVTDEELLRFIILAKGIEGFDILDYLYKIKCSTLVIGSKDDDVLGVKASLDIYDKIKVNPNNQLYLYDGYGHDAYDTAPDYIDRIKDFCLN